MEKFVRIGLDASKEDIQLLGVDGGAAGLATHLKMWPGSGVLQSSEVAAGQTSWRRWFEPAGQR
ncbi:hypothetical protein ABIF86_000192 [Bradyrhizobium japonicum]